MGGSYGDHMGIIWGSYGDMGDPMEILWVFYYYYYLEKCTHICDNYIAITNRERMHTCEQ